MTTQSGGHTTEQKQAAERIEEARQLYETIGETDLGTEMSTSTPQDVTSGAALVASASAAKRLAFLAGLTNEQIRALPYLFDFWALDHQLAPKGGWRTWVVLGGRGEWKTRASAEWVRSMVEGSCPRDPGQARRVGLIGETMEQVREVMVFGENGILACSPPDRRLRHRTVVRDIVLRYQPPWRRLITGDSGTIQICDLCCHGFVLGFAALSRIGRLRK
jgi:hypothetical protein